MNQKIIAQINRLFKNRKMINKEFLYSVLLIIFPLAILFSLAVVLKINNQPEPELEFVEIEEAGELVNGSNNFNQPEINITAKAAYVKRLNTNEVFYSKEENVAYPLASITKVMTALVAYEKNDLNTKYAISLTDLETEGEYGLFLGERFTIKELIDFSLIRSANDTATALVSATSLNNNSTRTDFVNNMNVFAQKIGMQQTTFKNETGLDLGIYNAGALGSAKDISVLFEYITRNHPSLLEASAQSYMRIVSEQGAIHDLRNTNEVVGKLPGLLASKTGYTDIAGGNLAVLVDIGLNDPYVIVVLGSTRTERFNDVKKIISSIINNNL